MNWRSWRCSSKTKAGTGFRSLIFMNLFSMLATFCLDCKIFSWLEKAIFQFSICMIVYWLQIYSVPILFFLISNSVPILWSLKLMSVKGSRRWYIVHFRLKGSLLLREEGKEMDWEISCLEKITSIEGQLYHSKPRMKG